MCSAVSWEFSVTHFLFEELSLYSSDYREGEQNLRILKELDGDGLPPIKESYFK